MNNVTDNEIKHICDLFQIQGEYLRFELITNGHINTTYKVYYFRDNEIKDYILQKVNTYVFKNPKEVMNNIISITEYVRKKIKMVQPTAKRNVLHYSFTKEGQYYVECENGDFWRCSRFIDDSLSFLNSDSEEILYEAGLAFGEFQNQLNDFPVEDLFIAIPHFHNTINRYKLFKESIENNFSKRKDCVQDVISEYLSLEEIATKVYQMQLDGELKLRVTHNDTKCSNVLFDKSTGKHLAVIDLDTVMPGLVAFDYGDAIRAGANTAEEDEKDLSKIKLDLGKFEAFTKGFMQAVGKDLTEQEIYSLAYGAIDMTLECGVRFLTDYLDGDKYFHTDYPEHNLVRAKCQLQLAKDMIMHLEEMQNIVKKYV